MASVERIKELLGNGLTNEVVASAVGVTPSYISQLMSQEEFSADVVALRTKTLMAATARDRSWDGIEEKLLDKLEQVVSSGMIYKPQDLLRALVVANNAKRRGNTVQDSLVANKTVISINIPVTVMNHYKKNAQGEVIEVTTPEGNTQTLTTMPAAALMRRLTEQHQGVEAYDAIRRHLPQSSES